MRHTAGMSVALRNHWVADGSPYRLAIPPLQLLHTLVGYGYTVEYYPDYAHQIATPAEDHTAYSQTGWPITAAYGVGWADDIMPHSDPRMPTPGQLGAKMVADKQAGRPELVPLKYINWTDAASNCWHDKWQPDHVQTASSDRGHTHVSFRSDMEKSTAMANYDPVAELLGMKTAEEPMRAYKATDSDTLYLGNGMLCRTNFSYAQFKYMVDLGLIEKPPAGQPTAGPDAYGSMIWVLIPGQVENYAGVLVPWASGGSGGNFPPYTITFTGTGSSAPA